MMTKKTFSTYAMFILGIFVLGFLSSRISTPGLWYENLIKPPLNPPNYLFGIVWPILYIMIAFAGARTWLWEKTSPSMKYWFVQMALNFSWSYAFFGAEWVGGAFVILLFMLAFIMAFIKSKWPTDRVAGWLMTPYALWVSFAGYLNLSIWILN